MAKGVFDIAGSRTEASRRKNEGGAACDPVCSQALQFGS
jgi:hypothetical protein